ncbi:MAG: RNA polymerase [Microgenomates group bacterium Gr01-1014_16]|nr:MAG: RNA polymerase [Microgenomates group bacterium Gr01-1014_16]
MSISKQLYSKLLLFLLKRTGGNFEVAQEVVQNTFLAAIKSFHTFHSKSTFFTWICKISLNKLADYYRGQVNPKFQLPLDLPAPGLTPEEQTSLNDLRTQVNRCLNLLPPRYRQLLHLKYYQELSTKEICLKLDLSPRSLEGKLYRAKKLLASVYEKST